MAIPCIPCRRTAAQRGKPQPATRVQPVSAGQPAVGAEATGAAADERKNPSGTTSQAGTNGTKGIVERSCRVMVWSLWARSVSLVRGRRWLGGGSDCRGPMVVRREQL